MNFSRQIHLIGVRIISKDKDVGQLVGYPDPSRQQQSPCEGCKAEQRTTSQETQEFKDPDSDNKQEDQQYKQLLGRKSHERNIVIKHQTTISSKE